MKIRPVGAEFYHDDRRTQRSDEADSHFPQFLRKRLIRLKYVPTVRLLYGGHRLAAQLTLSCLLTACQSARMPKERCCSQLIVVILDSMTISRLATYSSIQHKTMQIRRRGTAISLRYPDEWRAGLQVLFCDALHSASYGWFHGTRLSVVSFTPIKYGAYFQRTHRCSAH